MNLTIKKIALAAALALATPAMAQTFLKPQPVSHKYRDTGAKPATGRSGSAAIEARALIDVHGKTDVEVTTGRFEGIGGGGTLGKVQVKIFSGDLLLDTDNYKVGAAGGGKGTFSYDGLHRGHVAQVQANVSGIDANRTDVVTATTSVRLRPDLEATRVQASQQRVVMNAPVTIRGLVTETNGDLGARATCRLFADGVEIDAMPGLWVDAASAVNCEFRTRFASLGSKNVTLRVTDVEPADYDVANNDASVAIDVVASNADGFGIDVYGDTYTNVYEYRDGSDTPGFVVRILDRREYTNNLQQIMAGMVRNQPLPLAGRVTLRHSSGGVAFPSLSVAVQDLPEAYDTCRYGYFDDQMYVSFCDYGGYTYIDMGRLAGGTTYVRRATWTINGDLYFQEISGYGQDYGGVPLPLATDYSVELLHETQEGIFGFAKTIPLRAIVTDIDENVCNYNSYFYVVMCGTHSEHGRTVLGSLYAY